MSYRGRKPHSALLWAGILVVLFSILMYGMAPFHLQKFAAFPGLLGLFLLALWASKCCNLRLSRVLQRILWVGFIAAVGLFLMLQSVIFAHAQDDIRGEPQVMIVLGAQVKENGPSVLLADRLHTAFAYWQEHPEITIVVTGGQGPDEPWTEASAMAAYLIELGVPESQLMLEEEAHNTHENLIYSFALLAQMGYDVTDDMLVVSNGFHLARVALLWERVAGSQENLSRLAAPCSDTPAKIQSYIREAPALVKSWIFDR